MANVTAILLAGGIGKRFAENSLPKQYCSLQNKPLVLHSYEVLLAHQAIEEVIVVCAASFQSYFSLKTKKHVRFTVPGLRRQDSLYNGLQISNSSNTFILVHDAARPLITPDFIENTIEAAQQTGAATVAVPLKFTVKEIDGNGLVKRTPDRSALWEIQTPQVIRRDLLTKGFELAIKDNLTVTDDVSLVELFNHPVKLVKGCYSNLKITTPDDLIMAEYFLNGQRI